MLSFDNKRAIFKNELRRIRGKARHEVIPLEMKRDDVFELSFDRIMRLKTEELKGKIKIDFEGEEGEDAGGLTREWYMLLSREMFNPNYALFKCGSAGNTHHPSSMSYVNSHHLGYFKFIGRIVGKALYDGYLLDAYFTPAFYKHILNLPITYLDMEEEDYEYFKSLKWILENSPIQDYLELNFTYESDNFGEIQTKELLPGGTSRLVTDDNKLEYVQLISYAKMATNIKAQLEAFLAGFHDLIPHKIIQIFNEKELEVMISGRPTIDIDDLRSNTELVNYVKNDQIIIWLFEVLESFDMELRTAFIQFVTGSSRVPVEGFKDLRGMNGVQKFNIQREFQEERLPRAHTCFNQLDLPNYKTKEILIEKLTLAILEGKEGFGMI